MVSVIFKMTNHDTAFYIWLIEYFGVFYFTLKNQIAINNYSWNILCLFTTSVEIINITQNDSIIYFAISTTVSAADFQKYGNQVNWLEIKVINCYIYLRKVMHFLASYICSSLFLEIIKAILFWFKDYLKLLH